MPSRRTAIGGIAALAFGAYVNHRGLRYPRMGFEPQALKNLLKQPKASFKLGNAMFTPAERTTVRAIGLEPNILVEKNSTDKIDINVGNLNIEAELVVDGDPQLKIQEVAQGINRVLTLSGVGSVNLRWQMPQQQSAKFAVIGDTGAGLELEWVLQRASALGADFLLHLGDFNYVDGEYERAIELFKSAPLPCFVTIGNHDFNDSGLVYQHFLDNLGPLNHRFNFAGTQFINIDTAADFFPAYSGQRGKMLDAMKFENSKFADHVCFTHRNFLDPRPGRDHTIGGIGERPWLADTLRDCGVENILTGHVHRSAEMEYRGLYQFTVGEGLGFEDIVHEKPIAQLLLGTVESNQKVQYQWAPLELPWAMHTSPEHEEKLIKEHPASKLEWYKAKLAASANS